MRIDAQLQHVFGLGRPRQLGVERLVTERPEPRFTRRAYEEIRVSLPGAGLQRALINDLGTGTHGLPSSSHAISERAVTGDLDHLAAVALQRFEIASFVLDSLLL